MARLWQVSKATKFFCVSLSVSLSVWLDELVSQTSFTVGEIIFSIHSYKVLKVE